MSKFCKNRYFQSVRGDSALLSGVYVLPYVVVLSLVSALTGLIIAKTGRYQEVKVVPAKRQAMHVTRLIFNR